MIVVVGGGVIGLATAYEAARRGLPVTVLESRTVGCAATHGNAALITLTTGPVPAPGVVAQGLRWMTQRDSPLYVAPSLRPSYLAFLVRMARHCNRADYRRGVEATLVLGGGTPRLFEEYAEDGMAFEHHQESSLAVFSSRDGLEHAWHDRDAFAAGGVELLRVDGHRAVAELEPALSPRYAWAMYAEADSRIEPDSLTAALTARIRQLGGTVVEHSAVTGFAVSGGRVSHVLTRTSDIACDAVVLAAGPWTGAIAADHLGVRLPMEAGKGYHVDYTPPPVKLTRGLVLEDVRCAVAPLDGRLRVAGTMEFGAFDERVDEVRVDALRRAGKAAFTSWDPVDDGVSWGGMRPMTPDGLPLIGLLPRHRNVYVGSGHAMLGLTLAPATARALVDLITGGQPVPAAEVFDPGRFATRVVNPVARLRRGAA